MTSKPQLSGTSLTDLAAERAKSDALFSSIGEGVIATDEDGKIMKVNSAALDLLGRTDTDLIGKWYFKAIKAYDLKGRELEPLSRPIMRALLEGKPVTENLQYVKKDGAYFPARVTASPIMLDGKPVGTVEVLGDITREQQIDKAKTEFVSLASHQLRTPLTAVRWYLELMLRGEMGALTPKQRKSLEEVYGANLRLIDLVRALLSVARIELGTLAFAPVPSHIDQLAKEAVFELKPLMTEKQMHFTEHYDRDIPVMPLDPDLTHVIFQNLLTNAVKYTPEKGHISLTVTHEGRHILIKVADTGCGVPKKQQHQLFTKLFRADNVREKDPNGTGLGLYIIQSIVRASKGKIWFESVENEGTTFYVKLPLKGMPAKAGKALSDEKGSHLEQAKTN